MRVTKQGSSGRTFVQGRTIASEKAKARKAQDLAQYTADFGSDFGVEKINKTKLFTPKNNVASMVENAILDIFSTTIKGPHKPFQLRGSNLPYCQLLHLIHDGLKEPDTEDYAKKFYTGIGHALHEVLQHIGAHAASGAWAFGDWQCSNPKCKHTIRFENRPEHSTCVKCKQGEMLYKEMSLEHKGFSAHVDWCYHFTNFEGYYHIFDFKTTRTTALARKNKASATHIYQVESYAWLLWLKLLEMGREVKGFSVSIGYFGRDGATIKETGGWIQNEPIKEKPKIITHIIDEAKFAEINKRMLKWISLKKGVELYKANREDSVLKKLVDYRPCHSVEDYAANMQPYFQHSNTCQHLKSCAKGCSTTLKLIKKLYSNEVIVGE